MTKGAQHTASPRISSAVKQQNVKKMLSVVGRLPVCQLEGAGQTHSVTLIFKKCKA
jgi:hypothetical protein